MGGYTHKLRHRAAAMLALAGVIVYATLIPWHLSSLFSRQFAEAQLTADIARGCHSGDPAKAPGLAPAPEVPLDSQASCPICKGLAAFQLAILAAAAPAPLALVVAGSHARPLDRTGAAPVAFAPRNRGPPSA